MAFPAETNGTVASSVDLTRADVAEYLSPLAHGSQSGVPRACKVATTREWFRFLEAEGLVEKNPTVGVEPPKQERNARMALRPDEHTKRMSLAGGHPRDAAIPREFLQAGVRLGDLRTPLPDDPLPRLCLHPAAGQALPVPVPPSFPLSCAPEEPRRRTP